MLGYAPRLKANARALRGNLTEAEQKLWFYLRRKQINGWQFYRQKPVGPYIVDFYCPAARLVVELDGGQHFEPEHQAADRKRDAYLAGLGLRVLRFDNRQALQETEVVVAMIAAVEIPPGPPFAKGGANPPPDPSVATAPAHVPPFEKGRVGEGTASPQPTPATPPIPPFEKGGLGGIYPASTEDKA